jgi:predicted phosphodiesterase
MSKKINKAIRKVILKNIESCKSPGGRISWNNLLEILREEFPFENLSFDRVRSIYRNTNEDDLDKTKETLKKKSEYYKNLRGQEKDAMDSLYEKVEDFEDDLEDLNMTMKRSKDKLESTIVTDKNPALLSIEEIVKLFRLDVTKWECVGFTAKSWNSSVKAGKHNTDVVVNYSVKANFKLKEKEKVTKQDLSFLYEEAKKASSRQTFTPKRSAKKDRKTGNTLVLALFDQHLGKLAWGEETGENYDIKIASERFFSTAKTLIDRSLGVGFDKIIFPIGNDFFQFDGMHSETTKGTRVDSDIRWKKLFQVGVKLTRQVLDYASQFADIDVILVQGNHDNTMSFYLFETLRGWYDSNPNIHIDKDIKTRTYRQVGVNLLGFTHGDKEKDNIYRIMQQEARELWGKTLYSEWITGHYHKNFMDEKQGVTKRVVGSLTGTDAWHYESGYVGSLKAGQALIYNENQLGPLAILYESVNIQEEDGQK